MITLTTSIALPPVTRVKLTGLKRNKDQSYIIISIRIMSSPASGLFKDYALRADDGPKANCQRLKVNPNSQSWDDKFIIDNIEVPNAYTQIVAASRTGGNENAGDDAVEAKLLQLGMLDSVFAGT